MCVVLLVFFSIDFVFLLIELLTEKVEQGKLIVVNSSTSRTHFFWMFKIFCFESTEVQGVGAWMVFDCVGVALDKLFS